MTSSQIRQSFIDFFVKKGHSAVPSAPVIPHGDPTLLFTNAGMNQFKDVFLGQGKRDYTRAVDTQKCIRVSGKHNDLEEVGVDTYHHTLFEMLGNWSFGDYYKEEAIAWAWELLVDVWKLPKERLYATVFRTDEEARQIWMKYLPEDHILKFDEKDNFWEMGDTGPCGPCSEIHFDGTVDGTGRDLVNASSPEVIEIWNLVFIQYNRKADGSLEELSAKHVDTGMGFERITRVIQGKGSNYDTDIFQPLIQEIVKLSGRAYNGGLEDKDSIAMRVMSDHIRTLSFAIADGAMPGNEGRGYVLRRILRRACRFSRNLGFTEPVMYKLLPVLIEVMGDFFTELKSQKETIEKVIKGEEESFLQTLDNGLNKFNEFTDNGNIKVLSGDNAFLLYDSFGFPLDLTELIARDNGISVDIEGFNQKMIEQKTRSRAARKNLNIEAESLNLDFVSDFLGYSQIESEAKVLWIDGNKIVLDKTPFYTESGGQVSDSGTIVLGGNTYLVEDMKKIGTAIVHICDREIENLVGSTAYLKVDTVRRNAIKRNHSATHLMHKALTMTLGNHLQQQGSLVSEEHLRFDFNHFEKVSEDQIKQIETIVNNKILENYPVETLVIPIEEAKKIDGVKMFFGDKYGDVVRVVIMDRKYSAELCGGTHVTATGEIGYFKIKSEGSVAAGIRRIEAVTGLTIADYIDGLHSKIDDKQLIIEDLQNSNKTLEKELASLKTKILSESLEKLLETPVMIGDIKLYIQEVKFENLDQMMDTAENLRNKANTNSIILFAINSGDKAQLCCAVTDDIKTKYQAGKLVGEAAKFLGGGGGGKPHLASAGGKDVSKLKELLENEFLEIVGRV